MKWSMSRLPSSPPCLALLERLKDWGDEGQQVLVK